MRAQWMPAALAALAILDLGLAAVPGRGAPAPRRASAGAAFHPERVLVGFREQVSPAGRLGTLQRLNLTPEPNRQNSHFAVVRLRPAKAGRQAVERAIAALRQDPSVRYAEPDYLVRADRTPADPSLPELWGMHNSGQTRGTPDADIDAPEAWETVTGGEVVVAVIDTGVDTNHEDLRANILRDRSGAVVGFDAVNNDSDPMDDQGHGTHVAGTIAGVGDNGTGVVGVCWRAKIMPLKFLDADGSGYTSDAIRCVDFAIANGAQVMSNSWGGGRFSQSLLDAIRRARDAGILFIAAAGNGGRDGVGDDNDTTPHYPSSYRQLSSNVISVAATNHSDRRAGFSNYGLNSVDLGAPGASILSTVPGNLYAVYSGTSMATPHVAGAYALVRARYPLLTLEEWKATVLNAVDPVPDLAGRVATGGRLNIGKVFGGVDPPPSPPGGGDAWEPDNAAAQAREVQSGQAGEHTFHFAGDTDCVKFTLPPGASVSMATANLAGDTDTVIDLLAPDGVTLIARDDDGGGGLASRLARTVSQAGAYFLRVRDYDSDGGPGYGYTLTVRWSADAGDAYEPDNSLAEATPAATGQTQARTFHIPGDQDWVRIDAPQGARLTIRTSDLTGETDTVLWLFDARRRLLTWNDDAGGLASRIRYRVGRAGVYYLRVSEYNDAGGAGYGYSLTVQ